MRRATSPSGLLLAALLSIAIAAPAAAAEPGDPIVSFAAIGPRAFTPDGDGIGDRLELALTLGAEASVGIDVLDWQGQPIAALLPSPAATVAAGTIQARWDGAGAPDGPYRVRATAVTSAGSFVREIQIARVTALPYPLNPGSLTVFIDPGHGGDAPGGAEVRLSDGTLVREETFNLDIALKLAAMLRA